jgi:predicted DNA-binding WGR domain protein
MQHARHFCSATTLNDNFGEIHSMMRIDPDHNMHRFYRLRIQPDLFEAASLCIAWGRLGRPEQVRVAASGSVEHLKRLAGDIAAKKFKKGYVNGDPAI